jgi:tripartite-type tricarboxylate transporter receptor subunit TctC
MKVRLRFIGCQLGGIKQGGGKMKSVAQHIRLQLLILSCLIVTMAPMVYAQVYPNRAIDLVMPYGAGGGTDNSVRILQEPLSRELKVPINIVNRTGAGGVIGTSFVANSKPDGYTLMGQCITPLLIPQIIKPKTVPYNAFDFTPIAMTLNEPCIFVVRSDLGVNTFKEFMIYAKKNPGKLVTGTSGLGAPNYLDLEILKNVGDVNFRNITFASGAETLTQLLGGHIDWIIATVPVPRPHIQAGKLKVLAVLTPQRLPEFPDVPTMREEGFPTVNVNMDYCLLGPKGLPNEVTLRVANALDTILKKPEVVESVTKRGFMPIFMPPNEFANLLRTTFKQYSDIAKNVKGMIED